ncbi:hypothetical protein E2C01_011332 [Portunus trituberculatus]|uniref:Uncharacterized protein n=1 Tax=Portunus trituberculatus TaxID=210409 RepID=A0A5B7DAR9_PORTR|nr:hypothetical protein [Portunus trituberculatus]
MIWSWLTPLNWGLDKDTNWDWPACPCEESTSTGLPTWDWNDPIRFPGEIELPLVITSRDSRESSKLTI